MRIVVTGARGTVGTVLAERMEAAGHEVVSWDRSIVPIDSYDTIEAFLKESGAGAVYHLAVASKPTGVRDEGMLVNYHWPSETAWAARSLGMEFVYTSTAMVYTNDAIGPFTVASPPDATVGYGGEKARAEGRIFEQHPGARIVRLGWQIGRSPGGNNMLSFFEEHQQERGRVAASTRWLPACSFLEDTAAALLRVLEMPPGLYHADSNRGWNFHQIAVALSASHHGRWTIEPTEDFVYNQRLLDDRLELPSLAERLKLPPLE